ncbi:hypothetical protein [Arthrobacter sp. H35-D1]|uniref:hypothetical protein n=1 Tax=Arthrobacter sp. H35-D1 TaxID=3046202 RepID=UPI0024B87982|nr:hypothetical protein [Arthrobacter sp. H35-D1]MDJ0315294.1 hypothetical protein [Arthrobacter sp. H35-D1]
MSYSNPLPPMPGRPLAYWLDSDMARTAPQASTSALRDMAWIYGQWRGLAGAATGLGIALLGGGLLALSTMTSAIALWLSLILAGLALLATSILIRVLKLPQIPRSQRPMASRAPQKFSSGVSLTILVTLAVGLPTAFAISGWLAQGPVPAFSFVAVCLLFVLGTISSFALPAYYAENARRDFRRHIDRNAAMRSELENLSTTWRDARGDRNFGPL